MNPAQPSDLPQRPASACLVSAVLGPPQLLPGESLRDFETLRDSLLEEIGPRTPIELLWAVDLVELSWDVLRYRTLRQKVLDVSREKAIESLLQRVDLAGIPREHLLTAQRYTKQNIRAWRVDPVAAVEIETRLLANGMDAGAINVEVFAQARELYVLFDTLLTAAQNRRMQLLREFEIRRFGRRRLGSAR